MRVKIAALVLAAVSLAATARGEETYWLDVVAYPAIPGATRHLQIIHTLESDASEPDMLGRSQQATELMPRDVAPLIAALESWSAGVEPPNVTVYKKAQGNYYSLEITSRTGEDRHLIVSSVAIATTPGRGCIGCYGVVAFTRQQMPLSETDVLDLTAKLRDWAEGWNPPDAEVWEKIASR